MVPEETIYYACADMKMFKTGDGVISVFLCPTHKQADDLIALQVVILGCFHGGIVAQAVRVLFLCLMILTDQGCAAGVPLIQRRIRRDP